MTDNYSIRVYRYGLLPPMDWGDDCEEQLRLAHQLYNRCIEIERTNRERYREVMAAQGLPTQERVAALRERRAGLIDERKSARKTARAKVPTPDLDEAIAAVSAEIKLLADAVKAERAEARAAAKDTLSSLEGERKAAISEARRAAAAAGLWWGNYNATLAAFDASRAATAKTGREPAFRRWTGDGRIVNQVQGGMSATDLLDGRHTMAAIALADDGRRERRGVLTCTIYARGHAERRKATWPLVYGYPLPEDARIQEIAVHRRMVAGRAKWHATVTCRVPLPLAAEEDTACGIDVGWRVVNDGLRVATLVSDAGTPPEFLVLPHDFLRRRDIAADQQSERDVLLNEALEAIRALPWDTAPDALREASVGVRASDKTGPRALARLVSTWRREHAEWLPDALSDMSDWQRQDLRLWRRHVGTVARTANHRKDIYRAWAADVVRRHGLVGIERLRLTAMTASAPVDGSTALLNQHLRATAAIASPGILLGIIKKTAERHGTRIFEHGGTSTRRCAECHTNISPSDPAALIQVCPACGAAWDQDVNAARNILAAARASTPAERRAGAALATRRARLAGAKRAIDEKNSSAPTEPSQDHG